jgi:hypothetical protein
MLGLKKDSGRLGQSMIDSLAPVASRVFSHKAAGLTIMTGVLEPSEAALARAAQPKVPHARLPKDKIEPVKAPEQVRTYQKLVILKPRLTFYLDF